MEIFAASPVSEEAPRFVLLGMATGSLTALVALGIVLVYRTSGVLNFSAGALGGIAAFFFYDIRDDGYPTWWALTFSLAVGVLLGLLTYAVLASLRNASQLSKLIATLGLFSAGQAFMVLRWGGGIVEFPGLAGFRVFTRDVAILEMQDSRYEVLSDGFVDMLDPPPLG